MTNYIDIDSAKTYLTWLSNGTATPLNIVNYTLDEMVVGDVYSDDKSAMMGKEISIAKNAADNLLVSWASIHHLRASSIGNVNNKHTADDVLAYRFLAIDLDRTVKAKVCANQDEIDLILKTGDKIKNDLVAMGLPIPLVVQSGNGIYLLFLSTCLTMMPIN